MFGLGRSESGGLCRELQELCPEVICYSELQNKALPTQCKLVSNTGNQEGSKVYDFYF